MRCFTACGDAVLHSLLKRLQKTNITALLSSLLERLYRQAMSQSRDYKCPRLESLYSRLCMEDSKLPFQQHSAQAASSHIVVDSRDGSVNPKSNAGMLIRSAAL